MSWRCDSISGVECFFNCLLAVAADVGKAHAIGRQHAGEGVDVDRLHAERVGNQAGVLAAGAAKQLSA